MFLGALDENERRAFLDLAVLMIRADGALDAREQRVFESYKHECALPEFSPTPRTAEALAAVFGASARRKQRIVVVELLGIALADRKVDVSEAKLARHLAETWGLSDGEYRRLSRWTKDFVEIVEDGYRLVGVD